MGKLLAAINLLLVIASLFVAPNSANAEDAEMNVVRVGIVKVNSSDDFAQNNLNNYALNYLNEIAKHTNRQFEFYYGTLSDCRDKLTRGEIQLISSVTDKLGSNEGDIFIDGYTCYNLLSLWTSKDSPMKFDEPVTMHKRRIGIVDNEDVKSSFEHFAAANDWQETLVPFPTPAAAVAALHAGQVDAVVDDGKNVTEAERAIVPFATIEANFITDKKYAELAEHINTAIMVIETRNPFFETWLEQEFLDPAIQHIVRFSAVEREYIKNAPTFNAAFLPTCLPLYGTGDAFADAGGMYMDFLHLMAKSAGLNIKTQQFASTKQIEDGLRNGSVDLSYAVYSHKLKNGVYFTNDIRKETFAAVKRRRGDADNNTIAVPMLFVGIKDFFVTRFPDKTVRQYNNVTDCINAVENGKCSVAFVPSIYLMYENALVLRPNLITSEEESIHVPVCLAVSEKSPHGLQGVLNTAALLMTNEQKRGIIFKNARPPFSFSYILSQYPLPVAMVLCLVILGGSATMFILFRSRMQERQNLMLTVKNAELQSALDSLENMRRDRDIYKSESETDRLTGLINKVAMETLVAFRVEKFPPGITAALYIIDLDHFKEANDTYGHQYGDEILMAFARSLRGIFRSTDIVGRFGGDEFVVFIAAIPDPGIIERQARHVLQVARSIEVNKKNAGITASVGIALLPQHGKNYDELFRIADRALYNVKENGRDGYCVYQQEIVR